MNRTLTNFCAATAVLTLLCVTPAAALTLQPLSSFGGGDGWLAPAEATFLQGSGTQRGMTYNSANNHVYVVDRNGGTFVRVIDGDSGALLSSLDTTGVAGGTFTLNMIDVADDGAIYAANLDTTGGLNVYRWANEGAAPTVAFSGATGLPRAGDSFAVKGAGASTQIIASGSGSTGFARFQTVDGLNFTGGIVPVTGAAAGGFRLGLDFVSDNTAIGKQTGTDINDVGVGGGAANVNSVNSLGEAPLAFDSNNGLLATVDINSSDVRLYDGTDLTVLTSTGFMDIKTNLTVASIANGNGTGDLKFGTGPAGDLRLYALNSNNGIQAFSVVPEPTSLALAALALAGVPALRRRWRG